jgi:hypothetical protein
MVSEPFARPIKGKEIADHPIVVEHAVKMVRPVSQEILREPFDQERLERHVEIILPALRHPDQRAGIAIPCVIRLIEVVSLCHRGGYRILPLAFGIANNDAAIGAAETDRKLNRDGIEWHDNDVTISAHACAGLVNGSASLISCKS